MTSTTEPAIAVVGLTKDYGKGRGVFGIDLEVGRGEVLGFLGPNGAGKTVTLRHLMGFVRPQKGKAEILGLDCFRDRPAVQRRLGYLPGENVCMGELQAREFLSLMASMRGLDDHRRMHELMEVFELDSRARIATMSKGNRQKVAIVNALMAKPDVLLLDEPTSGLDPLMQERFMALITEERDRGAAILLSSHVFEEVERACDRVAFIRNGRIVLTCSMNEVRAKRSKAYVVTFASREEKNRWQASNARFGGRPIGDRSVELDAVQSANELIRSLSERDVEDLSVRSQTLEGLFLHLYEKPGDSAAECAR